MIQHWTSARGGAWRNPKPTGGPYVCEQCRLDACGGNDATLTMQAVTTIELAPCGRVRQLRGSVVRGKGRPKIEPSGLFYERSGPDLDRAEKHGRNHDPQEMERRRAGALGGNRG